MKKLTIAALLLPFMAAGFFAEAVYAGCGFCAQGKAKAEGASKFIQLYDKIEEKNGVKEITYDEFMNIKNSGERYVLADVLPKESYRKGHIAGAVSLPYDKIDKKSAKKALKKGSHVIVYCANFDCHASTMAAQKLSALGYKVLDYKGGLKEWQEKGNNLVR